MGSQWSMFVRLLMEQVMTIARRQAEQRRRDAETRAQWEDNERIAAEQRLSAERTAVEARDPQAARCWAVQRVTDRTG
ncbi:hypothetical protein AB0B25_04975 [Nocardia sp. NPDC049190]|uniref:hypothetical protein n=1 Tax=Nocardia sp. NPDC049190 TaxID=3155650 RepID=UPI0033F3D1DE